MERKPRRCADCLQRAAESQAGGVSDAPTMIPDSRCGHERLSLAISTSHPQSCGNVVLETGTRDTGNQWSPSLQACWALQSGGQDTGTQAWF